MQKAQKVKKSANRFSNKIILLIWLASLIPLVVSAQDAFEDRKKAAMYDYNEKLYGQALDSFSRILTDLNETISTEHKNDIKLKMARCHFELGQYLKAIEIIEPFLDLNELPVTFQKDNIFSTAIDLKSFLNILYTRPLQNSKHLKELFEEIFNEEIHTTAELEVKLNRILDSERNCKIVIKEYLHAKEWQNLIIFEYPEKPTEKELQVLARLILEAVYPFNSYYFNQMPLKEDQSKLNVTVKNDNFYEALYWRSRIYLLTGYYSLARNGFEEVLTGLNFQQKERIIECRFYKALSKYHLNLFRVVLNELESLNTLYGIEQYYKDNFYEETYFYMGRCLYELSRFDQAIHKLRTITTGYDNREPRNRLIRNAYYWLAESYYCKGEFDLAIKAYSVILEYGTLLEKENAHYGLGWSYFEKHDLASKQKAKKHFQTIITQYPNTPYKIKAQLKLAEIEFEEGHADEGEKIIEILKNSKENDYFFSKNINSLKQTDFLFGLLYVKKENYEKAIEHFNRGEDTTDPKLKQKIYFQKGFCYKKLGDYNKAISHLSFASENQALPNIQVEALSLIADCYFLKRSQNKDLDTSKLILQDLIREHPNHPLNITWRENLAKILRIQNHDDDAIKVLNEILEENMNAWEAAQMEIGNILMSAAPPRFNEATNQFKLITEKAQTPKIIEEALLNYGISLHKDGKYLEAISNLQRLSSSAKSENVITDALLYIAYSFEKENDINNALKTYEDSLSQYPKQRNANRLREECVKLYHQTKQFPKAVLHLMVIQQDPNEKDINKKAEALYQLAGYDLQNIGGGNQETALKKLNEILAKYSDAKIAAEVSYRIGQIHETMGRFSQALKSYQETIEKFKNEKFTAKSYYQIAHYFYQNKQFKEAIDNYNKIKVTPELEQEEEFKQLSIKQMQELADSYFQIKDFPTAKDEYMSLIRTDKNNNFYKLRYGKSCLESQLRIGDAISIIERIPLNEQTKESETLLEKLRELQQNLRKK